MRSRLIPQIEKNKQIPETSLDRRKFLQGAVGALAVAAAPGSALALDTGESAEGDKSKPSETFVKRLYESLTEEQRKIMHFPFDHPLRSKISNNWNIVDKKEGAIGKLYSADQKELIRQIFKGLVTEDGYERFQRQMRDDAGGFDNYTCALFGAPDEDKLEWVMTGRHLTIRADGNSVENVAFGGPIFYGHAVEFDEKPDHPGNVWWHQAKLANAVYESLDGKQREKALLDKGPPDNAKTIILRGAEADLPGLSGRELSEDQKEHLGNSIRSLMAMYRQRDVKEAMRCLKQNGGIDSLTVSFYKEQDLGGDKVWDRWRIEGPAFVWHFRGSPHVHTWVHIAHKAPVDMA